MQATVEMRRAKEATWLCKNKAACKLRRKEKRAVERALKKGAKS